MARLCTVRFLSAVRAVAAQGTTDPRADTSMETTGWDTSGWDPAKESEEKEKRKAEERRAKARESYLAGVGRTPILSDESTKEQVTEAAGSLRGARGQSRGGVRN